jgi:hypothetical protein
MLIAVGLLVNAPRLTLLYTRIMVPGSNAKHATLHYVTAVATSLMLTLGAVVLVHAVIESSGARRYVLAAIWLIAVGSITFISATESVAAITTSGLRGIIEGGYLAHSNIWMFALISAGAPEMVVSGLAFAASSRTDTADDVEQDSLMDMARQRNDARLELRKLKEQMEKTDKSVGKEKPEERQDHVFPVCNRCGKTLYGDPSKDPARVLAGHKATCQRNKATDDTDDTDDTEASAEVPTNPDSTGRGDNQRHETWRTVG